MNADRLFSLFTELCLIDAPALEEKDSVAWTRHYLEKMGLEVWEDDAGGKIGGNANNLIAKLPASRSGLPGFFFSAHFDTVEPTKGLEIALENGVYRSKSDTILGADDKAGMAPAIEAVHSILESGEPHGDIYLALSVAEEIGLKGAFALDIQDLDVAFGYVFDTGPPVGTFVNHVGTHTKIDARIKGKPAHAGKHPEDGINAIQAASRGIARMKVGRIDEHTTSNVGLISGGTAVNVVPAEAIVRAEARSLDEERLNEQVAHMRECLETEAEGMGAKAEVEVKLAYPGYLVPEDADVVVTARAAAQALGYSGDLRWTLGGSDANAYNLKGVPTIVCGTGMEEIHTHDEHVSQEDLVGLTKLAIQIVREVATKG